MWFWKRKKKAKEQPQQSKRIHATLKEVENAVLQFEEQLPPTVKRTILIGKDNRIDFSQLTRFLGGEPSESFYMSKETYEIFGENDKMIPQYLDSVQAAVDDYVSEHNKLPVVPDRPDGLVHYDLLLRDRYLKEKPPIPMYITDDEFMVTHRKPESG
ncbi:MULTISPECIES: DUF3939 domain-containing protein [unclassified Paenibacillus]|uniref:DUF3939 domain-containing protein n=1 Tax=unclassified Paenibacillus TaxID=185978 RepID=UPI001C0FAFC9|nr:MULTISPECIES: DUF3939 domain-containing protein [unclassified Paenibacillus]MBU5441529.1 DUF3939 domain-containing protein [Paenibacillus sp. MSJ-34]CAH0117805.1 hypothetical protein PAE9249_00266 [Paenibacillus sp. CECT 9249]